MIEGLQKIEGSKDYYTSADGRVFSLKEIRPYQRGGRMYYQIIAENGRKMYHSVKAIKAAKKKGVLEKLLIRLHLKK